LKEATAIAVATAREFLTTAEYSRSVLFACFSADALAAYRNAGVAD
jgi:O-acetyl-ADP-ribose deacetylase (regulator of RNase III)